MTEGDAHGPGALVGTTLSGRYRIERFLGEGGMGAVYQAEHTLMRKRMAIKVLHPEMTRLPEAVARFKREAMAAGHIDHPNVVTATDFGELADGSFFLALEFVEGSSLRETIARGPLDTRRALHIARQMASALTRAHALGVVHRDLKPENVMLVEREGDPDFVKVLDFGIAKIRMGEAEESGGSPTESPVLTHAGMVYGTPEYMAPEQALGEEVDARVDLYALGVMMFEMLTGVRPFQADSKVALLGMQVTAAVPLMREKNGEAVIPPHVEELVARLLVKEPKSRLGDAKELVAAIDTLEARTSNPDPLSLVADAPHPQPSAESRRRHQAGRSTRERAGKTWLIVALSGVAGVMSLAVAVSRGEKRPGGPSEGASTVSASIGERSFDDRVRAAAAQVARGELAEGIAQLRALESSDPARNDIHEALFRAYAAAGAMHDAMGEAGALLRAVPSLNLDDELGTLVRGTVRSAAQSVGASDPAMRAAADQAFSLMSNEMGTRGWDDLWEIAYGSNAERTPKAAARAQEALKPPASRAKGSPVLQKMSPALQVALDLRVAGATCGAKEFFERAVEKGDARALELLRQIPSKPITTGYFRKRDILGCLHDGSLARAILELDRRLRSRPGP